MILNICSNIGMFNIINGPSIYIFYILLSIAGLILIMNNRSIKFLTLKVLLFSIFFTFLWVLIVLIIIYFSTNNFHGCTCGLMKRLDNNIFVEKDVELRTVARTKVIIVGDSRMELIVNKKNKIKIPKNFVFIARSGADTVWFKNKAIPELEQMLNNRDSNVQYSVVINLGVNDIQYYKKVDNKIEDYISNYHKLSQKYTDVEFYLLSVNPIVEKKLNIVQPKNVRTTKKVLSFNEQISNDIKMNYVHNLKYCDAYNNMVFKTDDGLHYTDDTGQDILDYISNNCVTIK